MKKNTVFIITIIFTFLLGGFLGNTIFAGSSEKETKENFYKELDLLGRVFSVIEQRYVEDKSPKDLIYGAIRGMMLSLDPYSQFLTPEDYKELLIDTEGEFGGIGIQITIRKGLLTVVSPLEDTPGWEAGLEGGDIIVKINGETIENITLNEAVKRLRGKPGTKVTITVLKNRTKQIKDITITRALIKLKDIKNGTILEQGIGYVKLLEFRNSTSQELQKVLGELDKKGMRGLILDLRNNPGGLLGSAVRVASLFLEDGKIIVTTKSRGKPPVDYKALRLPRKYLDIPIVILINKGSASGSEIVAAALRENNRAILMGETSFGKGSVQTVIPLFDGSALRLTTAKYYTPLGNDINEKGVAPDIVIEPKKVEKEDKEDIFDKLKNENKKVFDYKKDYQIIRALDLIKGLLVLSKK